MLIWLEYKMYSMYLPSLKNFGEHLENLMYLNDIIFIKYSMYLCNFPNVFQGGNLSSFPSDMYSSLMLLNSHLGTVKVLPVIS